MRHYFLYLLKDPETGNPKYVGISNNPERRFKEHLEDISVTNKTKWILLLKHHNQIPILEVINESNNVREVLNWEIDYIKQYKDIYNLTNSTAGGEYYGVGTPIDVYTLEGEYIDSYYSMVEYVELHNLCAHYSGISAVCQRKRNYAYGRVFRYVGDIITSEDLIRLKRSLEQYKHKHFYILNLDGNIVGEFNSFAEAERCGFGKQNAISRALRGFNTHVNDKLICYDINDYELLLTKYIRAKTKGASCNPVNQYTLDGKFVNRYWTCLDASLQFTVECISQIRECCNGKYNQAQGYIWKYANDINDTTDIFVDIPQNIKNKFKKIGIFNLDDVLIGEYNTVAEVSNKTEIPRYQITNVLKSKKESYNNLKFKYINAV